MKVYVITCMWLISAVSVRGYQLYNYEKQVCCGSGKLYPIPDGEFESYDCCYSDDGKIELPYNFDKFLCCNGKLEEIPNKDLSYECCGDKLYDQNTTICCAGIVNPLEEGKACCGEKIMYDETAQLCCEDYFKNKEDEWELVYKLYPYNTSDGYDTMYGCGLTAYNINDEICCDVDDNYVLRKRPANIDRDAEVECCGNNFITDFTTKVCHNGQVKERPSEDHDYCGNQLIDYSKQSCCYDKESYDDDSSIDCCEATNSTYDTEKQACCGTELVTLTPEDKNKGFNACCYPYDDEDED